MRLESYERAIYGLVYVQIESLLSTCNTYTDYLWAYTFYYIQWEIHFTLLYVMKKNFKKTFYNFCLATSMAIFLDTLSNR